ncbi:MAG: LptE family protein [Sphingobacteriaceae bacterium]|nr:LptE family protein [Sphingobacteriaceae bacterium]
MKNTSNRLLLLVLLMMTVQSCWVYKFNGASIPANMKTVAVDFFENTASMVVPTLSQAFTEELKTRIRTQSRLNIIRDNADAVFEGRITDYSLTNVAVTAGEKANLVRLSITVSVKYTSTLDPESSFEQSFTQFEQFSLDNGSIQTQEPRIIPIVTKRLTEDIFNKAFANW